MAVGVKGRSVVSMCKEGKSGGRDVGSRREIPMGHSGGINNRQVVVVA